MADVDPKPGPDPATGQLRRLYRTVGQLLALEAAGKSKGVTIDGDLEVAYPEAVKTKIKERIVQKLSVAADLIQNLQNDE